MAFSTQKEFFHVPFMNETIDYGCKRACVKLKSYESTIDDRSWALDDETQSRFLSDLVTCRTPVDDFDGDGAGGGGGGRGGRGGRGGADGEDYLAKHGIAGGDSLLECATTNLTKIEDIINDQKALQEKLNVSNERLRVANEENQKIKSIMQQKFDSSNSKDFYNKIQKLSSAGKLNKTDENELLSIYRKIEEMGKSYEIIQAENNYLKRLVEKLSRRATLDSIKYEPENSNDVAYLQNQVNCLRKEVTMLRKIEDDKLLQQQQQQRSRPSDKDVENIKAIVKERNALRDKCRTFNDLEKRVSELQKKVKDADHMSDNLSNNLDCQTQYIGELENKMFNMQRYYEDLMQKLTFNEELLKGQLEELRRELIQANCAVQKTEHLQMEVACLQNELKRRDAAISDYDCQYKQLMLVIDELQGNIAQNVQDTETQTCKDFMDDLAFFTSATLNEIMKELKRRPLAGDFKDEEFLHRLELEPGNIKSEKGYDVVRKAPDLGGKIIDGDFIRGPDTIKGGDDECCQEMKRLQEIIKQMQSGPGKAELLAPVGDDCESLCADALKKLQQLQLDYEKLRKTSEDCKAENERLNETLKENANKLNALTKKMTSLDEDMEKNVKETAGIGKDLRQSIELVKEISDIQLKNQQLTSAVNAINSRDDQKLIDDLRRQLREEQEKNKRCQQENEELQKQLKQRGIDVDKKSDAPGADKKTADKKPDDDKKGDKKADTPDAKKAEADKKADTPGAKKDDKKADDTPAAKKDEKKTADTPAAKADEKKPGAADKKADAPPTAAGKKADAPPGGADKKADAPPGGADKKADGPPGAADKKADAPPGAADRRADAPPGAADRRADAPPGAADRRADAQPGAADRRADAQPGAADRRADAQPGAADRRADAQPGAADRRADAPPGAADRRADAQPGAADRRADAQPGAADRRADGPPGAADRRADAPPGAADRRADGPPGAADRRAEATAESVEGKPDGTTDKGPAGSAERTAGDGEKKPGTATERKGDTPTGRQPDATGAQKDATRTGADGRGKDGTKVGGDAGQSDSKGGRGGADSGARGQKPGAALGGPPEGSGVGGGGGGKVGGDKLRGAGPGGRGSPTAGGRHKGKDRQQSVDDDPYQEFIDKNATSIQMNLKVGHKLEKELRKLLDAFMLECGFCFCKSNIPKSRFYATCHKILHCGIQSLSFKELVYLHRKIYCAAEKLSPGCLLKMILSEEQINDDHNNKCCDCRSTLCCSNSEEMLKDKVCKLERDIEKAKEYLENIKAQPPLLPIIPHKRPSICEERSRDRSPEKNLTYRQSKPAPRYTSKQLQNLKARIMKCTDMVHDNYS